MGDIIGNIVRMRKWENEKGVKVVYKEKKKEKKEGEREIIKDMWGKGLKEEEKEKKIIVEKMKKGEKDKVMEKWR